jgi:sugar phosphate permease
MIAVALPVAFFVKEPPRLLAPAAGSGEAPALLRPVLSQPAFYLLAIGSMASIGAVGGTMQNLKLYLSLDRHFGQREIAATLSLVLAGSIVGRLLMGWLADRWPKKRVMVLIYVIVAVTIPLMYWAPSTPLLKFCAFLFGVGLGGDYMIIPLMAAELFGLRVMGRLMGVVLTADGVAEAVVPMGVAALRDATGTYSSGFGLLVALAALGAVAVALLPKAPRADAPVSLAS